MSTEEEMALDPAPVVAGEGVPNDGEEREEVGEEEMGDNASGSELTELEEDEMEEIREQSAKEVEGRNMDTGRPNFPWAQPSEGADQSTQEFFQRGRASAPMINDSDEEIFSTPARQPTRGALARTFSAAAEGGPALTSKNEGGGEQGA